MYNLVEKVEVKKSEANNHKSNYIRQVIPG